MTMHTILFNLFASLALTTGIGVIFSRNPVHSVIFLILVFCNATGLLLLFKIELLAMMFIIIYVGAIAVLFLFVVMMLNIKRNQVNDINDNSIQFSIFNIIKTPIVMSTLIFITTLSLLTSLTTDNQVLSLLETNQGDTINGLNLLWNNHESLNKPWIGLLDSVTNIQALGYLIYTYYFYYFFMSGLILLIAMIGAIVLTMYKKKTSKKQIIYKQVAQKLSNVLAYTW